jgi:capsular exopolysaccharide synthesis family protein
MSQPINSRSVIVDLNPKSPISEAYRTLRTNIAFSGIDSEIRTIMITSARAGEGKTTTAANLAAAYAQADKEVILVDADLRKPMLHYLFNVSNRGGLSSILANQYGVRELIRDTHIHNLSVITSGPIPPNPSEMLASNRMGQLLQELSEIYDVVIIDSAPALAITDAQVVAAKCDGVLLVVDSGKVKKDLARKVMANMEHVKARVLGVVLNNVNRNDAEAYYYYYHGNKK